MSIPAIVTDGFGSFSRSQAIPKGGFSSYPKLPEPILAGKVYRRFASVATGTIYTGTAAVGDIEETEALDPSGELPLYETDGTESFVSSGRQKRTGRLYQVSLLDWHDYGGADEYYDVWYNNEAPVFTPEEIDQALAVDEAMEAVSLKDFASDAEDDALTGTVTSGSPPTGTTVHATTGVWSGTPTVIGSGSFDYTVEDIAGDTAVLHVTWVVADITTEVPDVVGIADLATATANIEAALLTVNQDVIGAYSNEPEGEILAQDPVAGSLVDLFSEVTLTVSIGIHTEWIVQAKDPGYFAGFKKDPGHRITLTHPIQWSPYWMEMITAPPATWVSLLRAFDPDVDRAIVKITPEEQNVPPDFQEFYH